MKRKALFAIAFRQLFASVLEQRLHVEPSRSVQGRIGWALRILRQKAR